jgi:LysR family transcriptional regulator, flagellar master operon regulator
VDLHLIRTFLEVCQTRHFGRAAEHLHVTSSAVSARVKTLEEQLGVKLFLRLRNGIEPTPTAQRLITQFRGLVSTWDQVRFLVSEESMPQPNLTVAASPGAWESLDCGWARLLLGNQRDVRLRLETHIASEILQRLQQGLVDLAFTLEHLSGTEVVSEKVGELRLRMMCKVPGRGLEDVLASDYIHIEWSTSFNTQFMAVLPNQHTSRVTVSNARLAVNLLADFPGAAYLSRHIVEKLRPSIELHPVEDAPQFRIPFFASYVSWTPKPAAIQSAIEHLKASEIG